MQTVNDFDVREAIRLTVAANTDGDSRDSGLQIVDTIPDEDLVDVLRELQEIGRVATETVREMHEVPMDADFGTPVSAAVRRSSSLFSHR